MVSDVSIPDKGSSTFTIPKVGGKRHHFKNLICWQKASQVRKLIYQISRTLPEIEKFGLAKQMRSAAISITANIAEGYGRFHYQENIQFCRQSRASLYECEDHLITCQEEGYITREQFDEVLELIITARKVLDGYINFLQRELAKYKDK
jgi:four helix bundle protein